MNPKILGNHHGRTTKSFQPTVEVLESRIVLDGAPVLIRDINPNLNHGNPKEIVDLNGIAYFTSSDSSSLGRSDGTEGGSSLLTVAIPGPSGTTYSMANPHNLTVVGNKIYFAAARTSSITDTGSELWVTDGTVAGTQFIKDIDVGTSGTLPLGSDPSEFVAYNGYVYFAATVKSSYGRELWRTNGTAAGTVLVANIRTGTANSDPRDLTVAGSRLYFSAYNSSGQRQLMTLNGSTVVGLSNGVSVSEIVAAGNEVYFSTTNNQLWKSNGTTAGTKLITTNYAGAISNLTVVGTSLFYLGATYLGPTGLFRSDGTPAGSYRIDANSAANLVNFNGTLYFSSAPSSTGRELYRVDATGSWVELVKDIRPGTVGSGITDLVVAGSTLYFTADNGVHGQEVWKSDGTGVGTVLVSNIAKGSLSSSPTELAAVGDRIFFQANDGKFGREMWVSDGTLSGTKLAFDIASGGQPSMQATNMYALGDTLIFIADSGDGTGRNLYKTNSEQRDVEVLYDFPSSIHDNGFTEFNGALYFGDSSGSLWRTDGTATGTFRVSGGFFGVRGDRMGVVNGKLYFVTNESLSGFRLWVTDGTAAGTQFFKDLIPNKIGETYGAFFSHGNKLYFTLNDGIIGSELWVTDGTLEGTQLIKDLTEGSSSSDIKNYTVADGELYFTVNDNQLWKTDGTSVGTIRLALTSTAIHGLVEFNGELYFSLDDGGLANGQLWKTDGTAGGTLNVTSLGFEAINSAAVMSGTIYFLTSAGNLYRSDGTAGGTVIIASFVQSEKLSVVDGMLIFVADDGTYGQEIWISDGTTLGTNRVSDAAPGSAGFRVLQDFIVVDNHVYFRGDDGIHGAEPWMLKLGNLDPVADAGGAYVIIEGDSLMLDATDSYDPELADTLTYSWDVNGDGIFDDAIGANPTLSWEMLLAIGVRDNGSFAVQVRVEDGNGGIDISPSSTLTVINAAPNLQISGVSSAIRGEPTSWTLVANDPSPDDQLAGFTFHIDWDSDGTIDQTVNGQSGITVSHAFTHSGTPTVRVTAEDKDGGVSNAVSHSLPIVGWELRTRSNGGNKTDLFWSGTDGIDAYAFLPGLVITLAEGDQIFAVQLPDGQLVGQPRFTVIPSFSGSLYIYGRGGSDLILADVMSGYEYMILDGGDGNDILVGGRGSDIINGGAGNDILLGGTLETDGDDSISGGDGDDLIVGHYGADGLYGNSGNDLIIASALHFNNLPNAVFAIQAEWTSSRSYGERVANLTGSGNGQKANGEFILAPSVSVLNDAAVDYIAGNEGQDWVIADVSLDFVEGLEFDEFILDIGV